MNKLSLGQTDSGSLAALRGHVDARHRRGWPMCRLTPFPSFWWTLALVCAAFHDETVRGVKSPRRVQADEIWLLRRAKDEERHAGA